MATIAHNHLLPIMPTPPAIVTANPIDSRRILKRGRKRNGSVRLSRCLKYGNWNELTWSGHIWCRRMKKTWKRGLGSQPGVWGWVTRRNFDLHRFIEMRTLRLVQDCVISRYDRANNFNYNRGAKFQNGCLAFYRCYRRSDEREKEHWIPKSAKAAIMFGVTLF